MKKSLVTFLILSFMVISTSNLLANSKKAPDDNLIQLAILLDTSGSMDGLIEQAKAQLWKIVNELAVAKRNGKSPNLEVALYEYGKSSISRSENYLRMLVPLTNDLDKVSQELFKLRTNGGDEYCGAVIKSATESLKWHPSNNVLKIMYIAGNEGFTQGGVSYIDAAKNAIAKGIIVNTIFCGNHQKGVNTKWKHGADLTDGSYINIDHNKRIQTVKTPYDAEILKLGRELNATYISYGVRGRTMKARQQKVDMRAESLSPSVAVQRSIVKAKKQYNNAAWDLVDAEKSGQRVEEMEDEVLPENMKKMNKKERKAYVKKMKYKREKIQKKLKKLEEKRKNYIAKERKKESETNTLDSAIIKTTRKQAIKKNYKF